MKLKLDSNYYDLNRKNLILFHAGVLLASFVLLIIMDELLPEAIVSVLSALLVIGNMYSFSAVIILLLRNKVPFDDTITYNEESGLLRLPIFVIFGIVRFPVKQSTFVILREYTFKQNNQQYTTCFLEFRILITTLPIKIAITPEDGKLFYRNYKEHLKNSSVEVMYEKLQEE